ncbi:DUF5381 family protein [Bacillus massiliglaciei]|uniref:DUF5381 family protein n=1 Tax=Bacillus massiliglaciei TaxID=1816693 RepID=UPI000DA6261C|nr:DUF5381 family protein [Bacillus massiliglaciei]
METLPDENPLKVEARFYEIVGLFLATTGMGLGSLVLIIAGLQFDSKYSLLYLGAGIFTSPYGLVTTMLVWPAFTRKGKWLYTLTKGPDGQIISRKQSVYYKDIKKIRLGSSSLIRGIFFKDVIIETFQGKRVVIPAYNIIGHFEFNQHVKEYILPYMRKEARVVWQRKFENQDDAKMWQ